MVEEIKVTEGEQVMLGSARNGRDSTFGRLARTLGECAGGNRRPVIRFAMKVFLSPRAWRRTRSGSQSYYRVGVRRNRTGISRLVRRLVADHD
jgi:hypothetical protein